MFCCSEKKLPKIANLLAIIYNVKISSFYIYDIRLLFSKESENSARVGTHPGAQLNDNEIINAETYVPEEKKPKKVHVQSPKYIVYKDCDLDSAAKSGNIAQDLRQRPGRATSNNMMAVAYAPPIQ